MSEEFQGGIYGENLWSLSRRDFFSSSSCSISSWRNNQELFDTTNNIYSWSRLSNESIASDGNILQQGLENSQQPTSSPRVCTQDMIYNNQQAEENYSNTSREAISSSMINYWQQTTRLMDRYPHQTIDKTCQSPSNNINPIILLFDSYSYTNNGTTSPLLQSLLETDIHQQQSLLENPQTNSSSNNNLSHTFHKDDQSPIVKPSYLNACLSYKPLTEPQFLPPLSHHGETKVNPRPRPLSATNEEERDIGSSVAKKAVINQEPAIWKRPRVGTPSPLLPTFKVRKEKLGDRVTALQQLVSPFRKTDTASVLHEAIEYIKFLHDQVSALSGPYLKNGSRRLQRHREATHHHRDNDDDQASKNFQDLKSHGLCLVPISSTFPLLASETTTDLWTPTLRLEQSFR